MASEGMRGHPVFGKAELGNLKEVYRTGVSKRGHIVNIESDSYRVSFTHPTSPLHHDFPLVGVHDNSSGTQIYFDPAAFFKSGKVFKRRLFGEYSGLPAAGGLNFSPEGKLVQQELAGVPPKKEEIERAKEIIRESLEKLRQGAPGFRFFKGHRLRKYERIVGMAIAEAEGTFQRHPDRKKE